MPSRQLQLAHLTVLQACAMSTCVLIGVNVCACMLHEVEVQLQVSTVCSTICGGVLFAVPFCGGSDCFICSAILWW